MPYATEQIYVTWGGTMGGSAETDIWQCGVHMAPPVQGGVVTDPTQAQANAILTAMLAFHGSAGAAIATTCRASWVKLARLNTGGEYASEPVVAEATTPEEGNAPVVGVPPQVAMAVTLWSGLTLGRANYGRFYVPQYCGDLDATGSRVASGDIAALATSVGQYIVGLRAGVNVGRTGVNILELMNMSQVGTGNNKLVDYIRLGNVKDTQRRRRNQIPETYTQYFVGQG